MRRMNNNHIRILAEIRKDARPLTVNYSTPYYALPGYQQPQPYLPWTDNQQQSRGNQYVYQSIPRVEEMY